MGSQKITNSSSSSSSSSSRHGVWSVFDAIKPFPPTPTPDNLMARIDPSIAADEQAHATAALLPSKSPPSDQNNSHLEIPVTPSLHDARLADEAYKAACAALAAGKYNGAVKSLRIVIASCPPDKTSALAKLRSLLSIAESQQQKQKL